MASFMRSCCDKCFAPCDTDTGCVGMSLRVTLAGFALDSCGCQKVQEPTTYTGVTGVAVNGTYDLIGINSSSCCRWQRSYDSTAVPFSDPFGTIEEGGTASCENGSGRANGLRITVALRIPSAAPTECYVEYVGVVIDSDVMAAAATLFVYSYDSATKYSVGDALPNSPGCLDTIDSPAGCTLPTSGWGLGNKGGTVTINGVIS
jgi:hypothetical protein